MAPCRENVLGIGKKTKFSGTSKAPRMRSEYEEAIRYKHTRLAKRKFRIHILRVQKTAVEIKCNEIR